MRNPLFPEQDDEDEREFWRKLIFLLPILASLILFPGMMIGTWLYEENHPKIYDIVIFAISGGIITVDYILIVIRREAPRGWNLPSITGIPAVILGILGALTFGGATLGIVLSIMTDVIRW